MKWGMVLGMTTVLATAAYAQEADERAVAECKASGKTFVQVAECLPEMHVAYRTLDAFKEIYDTDAQPLKDRCVELNKGNTVGASTCVINAIKSAISLKKSIPTGETMDNKIFQAVASEGLFKKLQASVKEAQAIFPDHPMWGGNRYFPYK